MADSIYHFTWGTFCDWYVELIKGAFDEETIVTAAENGADTFVAGSSVFRGEPAERIAGLRAAVAAHSH